jgi:SAM-dependent methyltransferase
VVAGSIPARPTIIRRDDRIKILESKTFLQSAYPIDLTSLRDYGSLNIDSLNQEVRIKFCEASNVAFLYDCPSESFYKKMYTESYWVPKKNQSMEAKRSNSIGRLKRINRALRKSRLTLADRPNVLEIGCGNGFTVARFATKNQGGAFGVEPSDTAIATCKKIGVRILGNTIGDLADNNIAIDCVLMIHVLEHLIDPDESLDRLGQFIKKGTLLLLEVPDLEALNCVGVKHPFGYTVRGLYLLLNKYGFRIAQIASRKSDIRQFRYITLAAVYEGDQVVDQSRMIPPPITLEELLSLQDRLNPGRTWSRLKKIKSRYSITVRYIFNKLID